MILFVFLRRPGYQTARRFIVVVLVIWRLSRVAGQIKYIRNNWNVLCLGGGRLHCDHFDIDFPGPIAVAEHPFEPAILWFRAPHRFGSRDLMYSSDFSHCFLSGNPLSCTSWTTPVNKKFGNLPSKKLRMVPCKLSRPFYDIKLSFSNAQKEDF